MAKYQVGHRGNEVVVVEAKSLNGAIKKSGYEKANVVSVSLLKPVPTSWCSLIEGGQIKMALPGGAEIVGSEEQINVALEMMGYGSISIEINMMRQRPYIEAVGTPGYCSPSSESYWSM